MAQGGARATSVADYHSAAFPTMYPDDFFAQAAHGSAALREREANAVARQDADRLEITLRAGEVNVSCIPASALTRVSSLRFTGASPSVETPLIIDVTDPGSTGGSLGGLRLLGDPQGNRFFAPFITWNLHGWESARLTGSLEMSGLVLAPETSITYGRNNPLRGQLIARDLVINGSGAIQHWQSVPVPVPVPYPTPEATSELTPEVRSEPSEEPSTTPTPSPTSTPSPEASTEPAGPSPEPKPTPAPPDPEAVDAGFRLPNTGGRTTALYSTGGLMVLVAAGLLEHARRRRLTMSQRRV